MKKQSLQHRGSKERSKKNVDVMNTVLGYKKRLKVIEDMIHIDYITIISYIHTHSSISHNVETIHPKVITYFTVLCINV